jgi:vitamin B12 transporter
MTSTLHRLHGHARLGARLSVISLAAMAALGTASTVWAQATPSLKEVVVTATRTAQPLTDVLADVSLIDRDTLDRSGAMSVADVLVRLPGVEFTRNGGPAGTTSLYLRGGETRHTLLLIDGVRVDSQSTGGPSWQALSVDMIDHIEVLRGPAAAIYGSDAVGGVVQIFTRKGEGAPQPSISVGVGSHGTRTLNASLSGAQGAWDYALGLGREISTGFNAQPAANPDKDGYRRTTGSARLGLQVNRDHRLEATWLGTDSNSGWDGYTPNVDDRALQKLGSVGLSWQAQWSDTWRSRVAVTQGHDRYETTPSPYVTDTQVTTYLWHNEWQLGIHQLTAALERRENQLTNASTTPANTQRSQNALALGYGVKLGAHTVQANLRHDQDSEFGAHTAGNLGYAYALTPQWRVTASAGTTFRAPTLFQRYSMYGVSTLKPEEGINRELGLKYADKGNAFSVAVYQNRVTDLINYVSGPGTCANGVGTYAGCYGNTGRASYTGVTLAGATRLGAVGVNASLDLQDPKDDVSGKRLARRAKQLLKLGADTQIAGWTLGGDVLVSGDRFNNAPNTQVLPGYGVVNLSATKAIRPGLDLLVKLDNVANKDYQTASGYATGGRTAYVGLKWTGR